ncbi:MAG: hypothetical protein HF967_08510 [Methanosarcinales archaeon]|nr:hypothetical protein [Methanosarcinales archaeon]
MLKTDLSMFPISPCSISLAIFGDDIDAVVIMDSMNELIKYSADVIRVMVLNSNSSSMELRVALYNKKLSNIKGIIDSKIIIPAYFFLIL